MDLASEESERLPCLLTLLDMGADVNARDKHGIFALSQCSSEMLILAVIRSSLKTLTALLSSPKEKLLCSMPWQAAMASLCTTQRTSSFYSREVLTVKQRSSSLCLLVLSFGCSDTHSHRVSPLHSKLALLTGSDAHMVFNTKTSRTLTSLLSNI